MKKNLGRLERIFRVPMPVLMAYLYFVNIILDIWVVPLGILV